MQAGATSPAPVSPSTVVLSKNPLPLSAYQEGQVRDLYYARVRGICAEEIKRILPPLLSLFRGLLSLTHSLRCRIRRMRPQPHRFCDLGVSHRTPQHEHVHGLQRDTGAAGRGPPGVVSTEGREAPEGTSWRRHGTERRGCRQEVGMWRGLGRDEVGAY